MATLTSYPLVESDQLFLDKAIAEQRGRPGALLGILEAAQDHEPRKFLSREALEYIAAKTDTPLARVYAVVTFYALFNLRAAREEHHLHLPRDGLPYPRFARTPGEPDGQAGVPQSGRRADGQDLAQYQ